MVMGGAGPLARTGEASTAASGRGPARRRARPKRTSWWTRLPNSSTVQARRNRTLSAAAQPLAAKWANMPSPSWTEAAAIRNDREGEQQLGPAQVAYGGNLGAEQGGIVHAASKTDEGGEDRMAAG